MQRSLIIDSPEANAALNDLLVKEGYTVAFVCPMPSSPGNVGQLHSFKAPPAPPTCLVIVQSPNPLC